MLTFSLSAPISAFGPIGCFNSVMDDNAIVQCPYCFEKVDLYIDPGTEGSFVEDCYVCCRPWRVHVSRDEEGSLFVHADRAQ